MTEIQNWVWDNVTEPHLRAGFVETQSTPGRQFLGMGLGTLFAGSQYLSGALPTIKLIGARKAHIRAWSLPPTFGFKHTFKTSGMKYVVARAGSRVIPVVGWAMLGYDLFSFVRTGRFWGVPISEDAPLDRLERFFFL